MATKKTIVALPTGSFETPEDFRAWLETHHASSSGLWVRFAKKGSGVVSINYKQALDEALCFGWIDSQSKRIDDVWYVQKFSPRGPKSVWSKVNREHVARLEASGAMRPAGVAAVDAAKADGRWGAAYDSPSRATVPADLEVALAKSAKARAFFETLDSRNRYAILHRIQIAKRVETRAKRIEQFVEMLKKRETLY